MNSTTREKLWEIVAGHREGVLATIGDDGLPHLSNVYYIPDGQRAPVIRISTTATRTKGRNLMREARAVLHVPGPNFFNFAVVEGQVGFALAASPGDPAVDELYAVYAAFNGEAERPMFDQKMIRDRRMIVRIEVTRLYGLVHRDERRPRRPEGAAKEDGLGDRR